MASPSFIWFQNDPKTLDELNEAKKGTLTICWWLWSSAWRRRRTWCCSVAQVRRSSEFRVNSPHSSSSSWTHSSCIEITIFKFPVAHKKPVQSFSSTLMQRKKLKKKFASFSKLGFLRVQTGILRDCRAKISPHSFPLSFQTKRAVSRAKLRWKPTPTPPSGRRQKYD